MWYIGIDIGSTYTKYCVIDKAGKIAELYHEKTPVNQKEYFYEVTDNLQSKYPDARIVSCGYGRSNIAALRNVNELTALALGAFHMGPQGIILDIGGQDTKIIEQKNGKLTKFFLNDKCAAGSGIFLSNTLSMLGVDYSQIDLFGCGEPAIKLPSLCAVFAQSEIVGLLADNTPTEEIIRSVIWHILLKSKGLLEKIPGRNFFFSGGMSRIKGIEEYAYKVTGRKCLVSENAQYYSAIGCALLAGR